MNRDETERGAASQGGGWRGGGTIIRPAWWDWKTSKTGPQSMVGQITVKRKHIKQFMVVEDMMV